jgi:hypothetical protein
MTVPSLLLLVASSVLFFSADAFVSYIKTNQPLNTRRVGRLIEDVFVANISQKTVKDIKSEAYKRTMSKDLNGLKRLSQGVEGEINNRAEGERVGWNEAKFYVDENTEQLEISQAIAEERPINRVASITVGLDEELKHEIDVDAFEERVGALFKWHTKGETTEMFTYMAPYFPVVQSSGTGKTRLFTAFRDETNAIANSKNYDCKTVLCCSNEAEAVDKDGIYFDATLRLRKDKSDEETISDEMLSITKFLQNLLSKSTKDKLVLLFDEAQFLLRNNGSAFRRVRWWLREERHKQVVAVFAGTTSKLAYLYSDSAPSGFSRDPNDVYWNWKEGNDSSPTKRYDPFYLLCTIGCFRDDAPTSGDLSDFRRAAYFGRPLFAYALVDNGDNRRSGNGVVIANSQLHAITKRMLTNRPTVRWEKHKTAICSILGSRVQMGMTTSFVVASELVSSAYAHLVHFYADENNDTTQAAARISFMPDPVCAALAMGLMHKDWTLTNGEGKDPITGKNPMFWSREAMLLLASGFCLPEKGNAGDIMGALYMLYCGDVLRHAADKSLRTFSVPLREWYSLMRDNTRKSEDDKASSSDLRMDVNFIQVCCNYFRAHSWRTQEALELMYKSGTAIYVFPDCDAIDIVAAIRVMHNGEPFYHPMLVNVKCYMKVEPGQINKFINKMKKLVKEIRSDEKHEKSKKQKAGKAKRRHNQEEQNLDLTEVQDLESDREIRISRCPPVLGLLIVIGAERQPNVSVALDNDKLGEFPKKDTFRAICVPTDDAFGISGALRDTTTIHEMAEIFSSHGFVYGEDVKQVNKVLRSGSRSKKVTNFVESLFKAFIKT